ncbi:transcription factor PIF3-like, partial [Gastrolobium bilobum]|uniref:transcription factor PIF3-like n=1 Tax=Gastrolobium bilobum TaxID=150636 RepID=UPI002AB0D0A9
MLSENDFEMVRAAIKVKASIIICFTSSGRAVRPENDFFELVWENGQISMQGLSNRARKNPTCKSFPSHNPRGQEKDVGHANGNNTRMMGKFGDLDTRLNDIRMSVPSGEVGLSQDEDVIPWLNYGMDDSLQHEYSSHFLDELSGVTINDLHALNNFSMHDRRSSCDQIFRDFQRNSSHHDLSSGQGILSKDSLAAAGEVETKRPPLAHQCQTSLASVRSDTSENKTTQHAPCGEITQIPSSSSGISSLKMEKQGPIMSSNSSTIMNFSHFARPASVVKANLQNIGLTSVQKVGKK